jgi:hypothetical protein
VIAIPPGIFHDAVAFFWGTRGAQQQAHDATGVVGQGTRGAVTGGQQLNGFIQTLTDVCLQAGARSGEIFAQPNPGTTRTTLPGFFRVSKVWDLLVIRDGQLLAVVEMKSQVGSFGNNYNNRSEEAIGSAVDLWTAFREQSFADQPPWLGYLFVLSDEDGSRSPVAVYEPHFPVDPAFHGASYARRYELLCRRLVLERHYSAACLLITNSDNADDAVNYEEPAPDLGATPFLESLVRAVMR